MADAVKLKTVTYIPNYTNTDKPQTVSTNPFDANHTAQNTETIETEKKSKYSENFIDELIKKYEKNPTEIFKELGINFTKEEKKKIEEYFSDAKSIKSFMLFVAQENLTKEDIVAGIEKLKTIPETSWLTRIKNVVKATFTDGIQEAFKLAKSERIYKAEKLSNNMNEIREEREDFSSTSVADIAFEVTENKEIKSNVMHFVTKKDTQNLHLYDEESTNKAVNYMSQNTEKADIFTSNAVELESIQDSNKQTKYKGSTIVNVSERMTEAPELKATMMSVGKKQDMNDNNFDNITNNLYNNPNMKDVIDFMATAIDEEGKDRFSAENLNNTSEYLLDKLKEQCETYNINLQKLTRNYNLSGDRITQLTQIIAENPEIKNFIINKLETTPNINEKELIKECQNYLEEKQYKDNYTEINTQETEETIHSYSEYKANTNAISKEKTEYIGKTKTVEIKGEYYDRKTVLSYLNKKFDMKGEEILQSLEHNPEFIDYIKQFVKCQDILPQLINNPKDCISKINKFKNASSTISPKEMNELIALSTNSENTEILANQVAIYGARYAISYFKKAKFNNCLDEAKIIYTTNTIDRESKKEKIDELIHGHNRSYCA